MTNPKELIPLHELIARHGVQLKLVRGEHVGLCPFHNEKSPSFHISPKGFYKCFGCGASGDHYEFLKQHANMTFKEAKAYLESLTGIVTKTEIIKPQPIMKKEPYVFDWEKYVVSTASQGLTTTMGKWLLSTFPNSAHVLEKYHLGRSKAYNDTGACIYWQIDTKGRARTGKVMGYELKGNDCKRVKVPKPQVNWVHSIKNLDKNEHNIVHCLFGEHLLAAHPLAPVVLVEAEKTALYGACKHAEKPYIWLATGGKSTLNVEKFKVLAGREVHVIADDGAKKEWMDILLPYEAIFGCLDFHTVKFEGMDQGADYVDMSLAGHELQLFGISEPLPLIAPIAPPVTPAQEVDNIARFMAESKNKTNSERFDDFMKPLSNPNYPKEGFFSKFEGQRHGVYPDQDRNGGVIVPNFTGMQPKHASLLDLAGRQDEVDFGDYPF